MQAAEAARSRGQRLNLSWGGGEGGGQAPSPGEVPPSAEPAAESSARCREKAPLQRTHI